MPQQGIIFRSHAHDMKKFQRKVYEKNSFDRKTENNLSSIDEDNIGGCEFHGISHLRQKDI